ncbi:MAG: flippase-like domain-containing protein [Acidobacteria bacterium]|nr:flippase-like domain-containing protein [Acidobacteriota bacterium]
MNKWLLIILKVFVSGTLLYVVSRGIDAAKLQAILKQAHLNLIASAVLLYCLGQMLCAYRWKVLMEPVGLDLSYWRAVSFYFLGMFFNLFFPTMVGGDAVKVYYLVREGGDVTRSTTTVLMDRDTGLAGLLLLAVVVAGVGTVHLMGIPLFPVLLGVAVLFALANVVLFYDPTYHWVARGFERIRLAKLVELTRRFHSAFSAYRQSLSRLVGAVGLSLIFDVALISFVYLAAKAIGWSVEFKYFCVFIPLIGLIGMIPITLYGFGLREYSFVFFFSQVGMPQEASLLLAFLFFFIVLVSSLPGAIIYIFYSRQRSLPHPSAL